MIELIAQCEKCGKAKIVRLEGAEQNENTRIGRLLDFINSSDIRNAVTNDHKWRSFQNINKLLCDTCQNTYRAHVGEVDKRAGEEEAGFFK